MITPHHPPVDGPPPTPFQRARRRRRRRLVLSTGVMAAAVFAVAVLVYATFEPEEPEEGLAAEEADPEGTPEDVEEEAEEPAEDPDLPEIEIDVDDDGRPDTDVPEEEQLDPPQLDGLDADERALAELLLDIDASERAMLGFQIDVVAARGADRPRDEADEVDIEIRVAALRALESLAALRGRMEEPHDDARIEEVREAYVVHLDSWVRWLEVIADDPEALDDQSGWFTIDINRTAAAFVRSVDQAMTDDLDAEVVRFAEGILARGFPPTEDAPV